MSRESQKEVTRRIKELQPIASAARQLATVLGESMSAKLAGIVPEGESLADLGAFSRHLGLLLETLLGNLQATAAELVRVRSELRALRRERAELRKTLRRELIQLRKLFRGVFGQKAGEGFLLLRGATPRDPHELVRWAGLVVGQLRDAGVELPPFRQSGVVINRRMRARPLARRRDRLRDVLRAIDELASAEKHAVSELDAAKQAADDDGGKAARFLVAAHDLAGNQEIAARLRPGVKPRGRPKKKRGRQETIVALAAPDPGRVKSVRASAESPPGGAPPDRGAAGPPDVDPLPAAAAVEAVCKRNPEIQQDVARPSEGATARQAAAEATCKRNPEIRQSAGKPSEEEIARQPSEKSTCKRSPKIHQDGYKS